jgi:hypothetical protein
MASTTHDGIDVRTAMIGVIIRCTKVHSCHVRASRDTVTRQPREIFALQVKRATTANHTPIQQDVFALKFDSEKSSKRTEICVGWRPILRSFSHAVNMDPHSTTTDVVPSPASTSWTKEMVGGMVVGKRRVVRVVRTHRHNHKPHAHAQAQTQTRDSGTDTCTCTSTRTATDVPDIE